MLSVTLTCRELSISKVCFPLERYDTTCCGLLVLSEFVCDLWPTSRRATLCGSVAVVEMVHEWVSCRCGVYIALQWCYVTLRYVTLCQWSSSSCSAVWRESVITLFCLNKNVVLSSSLMPCLPVHASHTHTHTHTHFYISRLFVKLNSCSLCGVTLNVSIQKVSQVRNRKTRQKFYTKYFLTRCICKL